MGPWGPACCKASFIALHHYHTCSGQPDQIVFQALRLSMGCT